MRRAMLSLLLVSILWSAAGCAPKLSGIEIVGPPRPVTQGEWPALTAVGIYEGWGRKPIAVEWSETGDACVFWNGATHTTVFFAAWPGTSVFTASRNGFTDTYEVTVLPAKVVRIETRKAVEMWVGDTVNLWARGYDLLDRMVLMKPDWSVSDELGEFMEWEDYVGSDSVKLFKALRGGVGTVSVEEGGTVGETLVVINPYVPYLVSMVIEPSYCEVQLGTGMVFSIEPRDQAGKYYYVLPEWSLEGDIGIIATYGNELIFSSNKAGTGTLRAVYGDFTATATIVVK